MTSSIFTDGACSGNGTARAVGGWAWAFWPGAARGEPTAACAKALICPPHATNQRAELTAILEAMRWASASGLSRTAVTIYSDSLYSINCASKWGPSWKRKGWKRDSGEALQNLDLIQPLVELWITGRWELVHVRGHQTGTGPAVWGNNWVDRAAVAGARGEGVSFGWTPPPQGAEAPLPQTSGSGDDVISHVSSPQVTRRALPVATRQTDIRNWFG
jgi:ribonuclease HI